MNVTAFQQMVNANADRVSTGMFDLIDKLQALPPGEQVAAPAVLLILIAERFGLCPHEAVSAGRRIIAASDHFTRGQQFDAAREYLKNEIKA